MSLTPNLRDTYGNHFAQAILPTKISPYLCLTLRKGRIQAKESYVLPKISPYLCLTLWKGPSHTKTVLHGWRVSRFFVAIIEACRTIHLH